MADRIPVQLAALARLYDIQTSYYDVTGRRRMASRDGLLGLLQALGAPVHRLDDSARALRERRVSLWQEPIEPVLVAWDGELAALDLRLREQGGGETIRLHLSLEDGETRSGTLRPARGRTGARENIDGLSHVLKHCAVPQSISTPRLPPGYHQLSLELGSQVYASHVISAPVRAYHSARSARDWGVFLPLYALQTSRSPGAGDLTDLQTLMDWVAGLGGRVVATLPLLATFLDHSCDPSPYAPASRLFWNEFYLDISSLPELDHCPKARAWVESAEARRERAALRASPLVDYTRLMSGKRQVLQALARCLLGRPSQRRDAFHRFVAGHSAVEDYARFRATCEQRKEPWEEWPARLRDGRLREGDYAEAARTYHVYAQWVADEQLGSLARHADRSGQGLYLDLPLGVHVSGYDVWRERASFVMGASGGAPPDSVFTKGQDWGFAPLHPHGLRRQGYRYFIAALRHHMRYASLLRIDHVMGLHRLYMIPTGLDPTEGAYVRSRADELYAILSLESHRHRTGLIGENLGTVPSQVNASLARHRIQTMYVVQYELTPSARSVLPLVPRHAVASLNTHDMPPFAAYRKALDIDDRLEMGLLDAVGARRERTARTKLLRALSRFLKRTRCLPRRAATDGALLRAGLRFLAGSRASLVLVNLEDLWLETQPQNVPDTKGTRPNWRRKVRYSFETFREMSDVVEVLRMVDHLRRQQAPPHRRRSGTAYKASETPGS